MGYSCQFFDGQSSASRDAELTIWPDGSLHVRAAGTTLAFRKGQYTVVSRISNLPITIEFSAGRLIQIPPTPDVVQRLAEISQREFRWLHGVESSYRKILVFSVGAFVALWICYAVFVPVVARAIAPSIPHSVKIALRNQILIIPDKGF